MNKNELLYEHIFCTEYGSKNRGILLERHKAKLWELYLVHQKFGVQINGKAIPFEDCMPQKQITYKPIKK